MWTILIGGVITTILSLIGSRIALWRAKVWLAENKHKIKWEIIYTIFGPDPNMPPVVVPPKPEREPWLPWRRRKRTVNHVYEPVVLAQPPSRAERWTSSLEFNFSAIVVSVPVSYLIWALTR